MQTGNSDFLKDVNLWALKTRQKLKTKLESVVTGQHLSAGPQLENTLSSRTNSKNKLPKSIAFKFQRHGVFLEKGVGRGRVIGSGKEKPKPWFNPVVEEQLDDLTAIASDNLAAIAAEKILIK